MSLDNDIMLSKLVALYRRLSQNHEQKNQVHTDMIKEMTKKKGEKAVYFPLQFLEESLFKTLHSVRLKDENGFFQIDYLIISHKFLLILEVKNWYGTVIFCKSGQVIRIGDNQIEEGFPNPIPQVELQKYRLQRWLSGKGINNIPIWTYVVISFPSTIVKSEDSSIKIPKKIIRCEQIITHTNRLFQHFTDNVLSAEDMKELKAKIIRGHTPKNENVLLKYGVQSDDLIKGVICKKCNTALMEKALKYWKCKECGSRSNYAYLNDINDYSLLINNRAKNNELRKFLSIDSPHVLKRMMINAGFAYVGENKGRVYILDQKLSGTGKSSGVDI